MRLAGLVAHMGGTREMHVDFWWRKGEERDHWEYQGIDGRIILKCLKEIGCSDMDCICLGTGPHGRLL